MFLKKMIFLLAFFASACSTDYSVRPEEVLFEEVINNEIHIDSYIQPSKPEQIDVLILLDTSCSMDDNYEQVSTGVEMLRNDLNSVTDDYMIGFINTSLREPYYVGPFNKASLTIDFMMAPWALGADTTEAGFLALYEFASSTPEGPLFFRETADKLFIFISDEDEQSSITVKVFEDWLKTEFRGVQRDIVSIVMVPDNKCVYTSYSENVGWKYINLARHYGKDPIDICSDWELWLSNSTFLMGPIDYINLSYTPIKDSIKIYVDRFETTFWEYDAKTNSVLLDTAPPEGSLVEAAYLIFQE